MGKYQYKIVITCAGSSWFRGGDLESVLEQLNRVEIKPTQNSQSWRSSIRTQEELDYAFKLQHKLSKLIDNEVRVEAPWISVYTNTKANVDALVKLDPEKVKYVSCPPSSGSLQENTVIMPKMNYDYKVTIGKTIQEHSAFIEWAEGNAKLKLTKSSKKELSTNRSWGGAYFYVTGDNNLLMAKMHLGGSINKVERIIKA